MFGGGRPGRGRAGYGPVPIPRGEKVQLLPLPSTNDDTQDQLAAQSLLSLPSVALTTTTSIDYVDVTSDDVIKSDVEIKRHLDATSNNNIVGKSLLRQPIEVTLGMEANDIAAVSDLDDATESKGKTKENKKLSVENAFKNTTYENDLLAQFGQALEFACGEALRKHVLGPVLAEYDFMEEDVLTEAPRLLSLVSKGHLLFMQRRDKVVCGSIERICNTDGGSLGVWYDAGDKFLSYVDENWSEWWVNRCRLFDPGSEMLKLCDMDGQKLGVAYIERNLVDRERFDEDRRGRITLVRGIRLAPHINKEVIMRRSLSDQITPENLEFQGVATLLLCHAIFLSLRYGTETIAVHPPKSERAEKFYESFMGPSILLEEDDGRRYYRLDRDKKWQVLQNFFRYQLNLFIKHREEELVRLDEEEKAANIAQVVEEARLVTEAKDAEESELAGIRQAEVDARREEEEVADELSKRATHDAANEELYEQMEEVDTDDDSGNSSDLDSEQLEGNPIDISNHKAFGAESGKRQLTAKRVVDSKVDSNGSCKSSSEGRLIKRPRNCQ
jgi:hypothetical protein